MIKFPKLHVAESVVNRIMNTADEIRTARQARKSVPVPINPTVPDPTMEGAELDMKMSGGVPPVSAPSDPQEAATAAGVLTGGDSITPTVTGLLS